MRNINQLINFIDIENIENYARQNGGNPHDRQHPNLKRQLKKETSMCCRGGEPGGVKLNGTITMHDEDVGGHYSVECRDYDSILIIELHNV